MDFSWDPAQQELRRSIVEFACGLNRGLAEREARQEFDREGWRLCAREGIHGLPIPTEYGGRGADPLTIAGALESLGYGCHDNGLAFAVNAHMWTVAVPIAEFGTEAQRRRFLPRLCDGSWIGANAVSEPEAGSDAFALTTRAERRGNHYVLDGRKVFVTNGVVADVFVVLATIDPAMGARGLTAFLVERDTPGLVVVRRMEKMGLNTAQMAELALERCAVPAENRLGDEGAGSALFTHAMTWERSMILAGAVGAMQRLLETCLEFSESRIQFGQPIGKHQLIASKLVDMKLRLETSRQLLYHTAWLRGQGRSIFMEAALTKLHISESWVQSALDAMQIFGARGYLREHEVERELRDAMASRIYSGTSEMQRLIIAPLLGV